MQLAVDNAVLETNVVGDSQVFKINATGAAFRTLIDGLYSAKEISIVRELATNAWDSHLRAGALRAFFVQTPTLDEPTFGVRDFGIGMDHEKVMSLYTTLFMSDKSDTNEFVGMFGLGSKSPFAYTDQFNLTCFDGRLARHYSCSIGAGSLPQINVLAQIESDEPRGIFVSFTVKNGDHEKFRTAVECVSLGFDPCFETNHKMLPSRGECALEGKGWKSYTQSALPSQWSVRQGCVIYPLSESGGLKLPKDSDYRKYLIDCPIGTIQVTASRETISYKPEVIAYLQERLKHLEAESYKAVHEKTDEIENVALYFDRIMHIKPHFLVTKPFIHPFTGLASTDYCIPDGAVQLTASDSGLRWDYGWSTKILARTPSAVHRTIIVITDYGDMLENAETRDKVRDFTPRERRKLVRRARAYAEEVLNLKHVSYWLGFELDHALLDRLSPNTAVSRIKYKDMPTGCKRGSRMTTQDKDPTPIRGISLAIAVGNKRHEPKLKAITEVTASDKSAYVLADVFRRESGSLREAAKHFGIESLYVVTVKAVPKIKTANIPSMDSFIEANLTKCGFKWTDYMVMATDLGTYSGIGGNLVLLGEHLMKTAPDSYEELKRSKTVIGNLYRCIDPVLHAKLVPISYNYMSTLRMLNEDGTAGRHQRAHKASEPLASVIAQIKKLDSTFSPLSLILSNLQFHKRMRQGECAELAAAILAVAKTIPPEKYLS